MDNICLYICNKLVFADLKLQAPLIGMYAFQYAMKWANITIIIITNMLYFFVNKRVLREETLFKICSIMHTQRKFKIEFQVEINELKKKWLKRSTCLWKFNFKVFEY